MRGYHYVRPNAEVQAKAFSIFHGNELEALSCRGTISTASFPRMIKGHDECTVALGIPMLFMGVIPSETVLKYGGVWPHITFLESKSPSNAEEP